MTETVLDGLLLIDKPPGMTSFSTLGPIKRVVGTRKVGHAGTLDKFATGLLLTLCGRATRFMPYLTDMPKSYRFTVQFGVETDTLDPEGEITKTSGVPTAEEIGAVLPEFRGTIEQVPPVYSAIKRNGTRLSDYARNGTIVEPAARTVSISEIVLERYAAPYATLTVDCSKGTYVRSLARDVAYRCGSCAHVVELRRTRIGPFDVGDAVGPGDVTHANVTDIATFVPRIPGVDSIVAHADAVDSILHGRPVTSDFFASVPEVGRTAAVFEPSGGFIALVVRTEESFRYVFVNS